MDELYLDFIDGYTPCGYVSISRLFILSIENMAYNRESKDSKSQLGFFIKELTKIWPIHKGLSDLKTKSNSNCEPSMASYLFFWHYLHDQFDQGETDIQNNAC